MENREKNQKKKTVLLLMALALMGTGSLYFTGNTFSSYMTEQTASGSAQIAKWDVKFLKDAVEIKDSFTFKLQDTKDTNAYVDANTVAPGDTGHIILHVQGTQTKVAYTYDVKLNRDDLDTTMGDAKTHIKFYKDAGFVNEWTDLTATDVALADANKDHVVNIYWKWIPEGGTTEAEKKAWNVADTAAGTAAANAQFTITLSAKQKVKAS